MCMSTGMASSIVDWRADMQRVAALTGLPRDLLQVYLDDEVAATAYIAGVRLARVRGHRAA